MIIYSLVLMVPRYIQVEAVRPDKVVVVIRTVVSVGFGAESATVPL
jgi:hypothetical protein